MADVLSISEKHWQETVSGLTKRSAGNRESACIWAGERLPDKWVVTDIIFVDDVPGVNRGSLHHRTSREALGQIFQVLKVKKLKVIADVHTHPGHYISLSPVDKANPIEFRVGLIAIIIPNYGQIVPKVVNTGVHEYLGNGVWRQLAASEIERRIQVRSE